MIGSVSASTSIDVASTSTFIFFSYFSYFYFFPRFGRLIHGSETVAKDVLEFVVFEKHLSSYYGSWRLHAKIIPDWLPAREPGRLTYRVREQEAGEEEEAEQEKEQEVPEEGGILDKFGRLLKKKQ